VKIVIKSLNIKVVAEILESKSDTEVLNIDSQSIH